MQVARYADPDAFLAAAAPIVARGEASASFFVGWAHSLKRSPPPADERVYLATCRGDGAFGVAIQRDVGPVLVGRSDPLAAAAFADDLASDFPALCGVMGAPAAAEALAERWRELTGRGNALRVRLRQHVLREVAAVPAAAGTPRVATEADLAWLIEQQVAFIAETGIHDAPERVAEWMPKRVERGNFWIWDDGGGGVALVGCNDAAPAFARIAPVYTVPAHRGRGYATALVAALARELLRRGKEQLFLTTDVANPTSNAIYARIGFRPESDDCALDFVDARG